MQVVFATEIDEDYTNDPVHCDVCWREMDSWEYMGLGDNRVAVCPDCECEAVECEECGKVTTDYGVYREPEAGEFYLCRQCAAKAEVAI